MYATSRAGLRQRRERPLSRPRACGAPAQKEPLFDTAVFVIFISSIYAVFAVT